MGSGSRVVLVYFALTYWLPMIANLLLGDKLVSSYRIYPLTAAAIAQLFGVYCLIVVLRTSGIPVLPSVRFSALRWPLQRIGSIYSRARTVVAVVALALAVVNFASGLTAYRYTSESISEVASPALLLMIIVNVLVMADLFYFMFVRSRDDRIAVGSRRYLENVLLSTALVVSASGIASMFRALVALFYSFAPNTFDRFLFVSRNHRALKRKAVALFAATALGVIFAVAWYSGQAIKVSSSADITTLLDDPERIVAGVASGESAYESFLYYLVERLSIYYYSLLFTVEASSDELHQGAALALPLEGFFYRVDFLLGRPFGTPKRDVASINQLNYQLLTVDPITSRAGSSPGLIASFNYAFAFPLNLLLCALYARWVSRKIDVGLRQGTALTLSWFGLLILHQFVEPLFQSPFDVLIMLDEHVLYVILLLSLLAAKSDQPTTTREIGVPVTSRLVLDPEPREAG